MFETTLAGSLPTYQLAALPGQSVAIDTTRSTKNFTAVGAPRLRLRVTSSASTVTLFASLWQVQGAATNQPRTILREKLTADFLDRISDLVIELPELRDCREDLGDIWKSVVRRACEELVQRDPARGPCRSRRSDPIRHGRGRDAPRRGRAPRASR